MLGHTQLRPKCLRQKKRSLHFEALESRMCLAGNVTATLAANILTLTGDVSNNGVKMTPGADVGTFVLTGLDTTTINGSTSITISQPFQSLIVTLDGGSDTFQIVGTSRTTPVIIPAAITIYNTGGDDLNQFTDVTINSALNVTRSGPGGKCTLDLEDSTVVGDTTVNNNFGGNNGDSKTIINGTQPEPTDGSLPFVTHLEGNLTINNGIGEDTLVIYQSRIDGNVSVSNGDGNTRTLIGQSADPVIWGNLTVINGAGNDKNVVFNTTVWGTVTINDGDGHTNTDVESSQIAEGVGLGAGNVFTINNGAGIDVFALLSTEVKGGLSITNCVNAADTYGSQTTIGTTTSAVPSTILGTFTLVSDDGYDVVTISSGTTVDTVNMVLRSGGSKDIFTDTAVLSDFSLSADFGSDFVQLVRTVVHQDTNIALDGGVDRLEILDATQLLGQTSLSGGGGIDTFVRQLGPPAHAVDIAFLAFEDFEIPLFILS